MRRTAVDEARAAAKRFIAALDLLETRLANDPHARTRWEYTGLRETGAVKRASLDLTRALADLRRP